SHDADTGYELGTALVVAAAAGQPLGPTEFRLRTAAGMLTARVGGAALPPGHVDELDDVMAAARWWGLDRTPVHVIDRPADTRGPGARPRPAFAAAGRPPATAPSSAPTASASSGTTAASASWARWSPGRPTRPPTCSTRRAGPRWSRSGPGPGGSASPRRPWSCTGRRGTTPARRPPAATRSRPRAGARRCRCGWW